MDKKLYSDFKKKIADIRHAVVEMKGPLEGISVMKKTKKASKKSEMDISVSNVIEKE